MKCEIIFIARVIDDKGSPNYIRVACDKKTDHKGTHSQLVKWDGKSWSNEKGLDKVDRIIDIQNKEANQK